MKKLIVSFGVSFISMAAMADLDSDFGIASNKAMQHVSSERQTLLFDGVPVSITTAVNVEQRIKFDMGITKLARTPEAIDSIKFETYGENLLLRISKPIKTRVQVRLINNEVIPIDINALEGFSIRSIAITSAKDKSNDNNSFDKESELAIPATALHTTNRHTGNGDDAISLIRKAAQQYYAPARLRSQFKAQQFIDVTDQASNLYRTGVVSTKALKSWKQGGLYVTSVLIKNKTNGIVDLNPTYLRGEFIAASFYDGRLGPNNSNHFDTLLFVVSVKPFKQAVSQWGH